MLKTVVVLIFFGYTTGVSDSHGILGLVDQSVDRGTLPFQCREELGWLVGFLMSSSAIRLHRERALRQRRERERETERQRDREREQERQTERKRDRHRQSDRQTETDTETEKYIY